MDYGSLVLTSRATGIGPLTRQTPFAGSRRQRRARLLRALVDKGPLSIGAAAALLGVPDPACRDVIDGLAADGLVVVVGDTVTLL